MICICLGSEASGRRATQLEMQKILEKVQNMEKVPKFAAKNDDPGWVAIVRLHIQFVQVSLFYKNPKKTLLRK